MEHLRNLGCYLCILFCVPKFLGAQEWINIKTHSGDWVITESYYSEDNDSWSCSLNYKSWKYEIDAFYMNISDLGSSAGLNISASKILGGRRYWWAPADDAQVPLKLGLSNYAFVRRTFNPGEISLVGNFLGFLLEMSKFQNVDVLVEPNQWSEREDWGGSIMSIQQVGLKDALDIFTKCHLKYK